MEPEHRSVKSHGAQGRVLMTDRFLNILAADRDGANGCGDGAVHLRGFNMLLWFLTVGKLGCL